MRQLTITRRKAAAKRFVKIKVCIEDETGDILYGGIRYRKIGVLRNGETATFPIDEQPRRIFTYADRITRSWCNDLWLIPAGEEDVVLTGRTAVHILNENAFRFDGIPEPEVLANRNRCVSIGGRVIACALVIGMLIGVGLNIARLHIPSPETVTFYEMTLTLTNRFERTDPPKGSNCDALYRSNEAEVAFFQDSVKRMAENERVYTLRAYAAHLANGNSAAEAANFRERDGLLWREYASVNGKGEATRVFAYFFQSDSYYYCVRFTVSEEDMPAARDRVAEWAESVELTTPKDDA